eukprot:scaffold15394_cov111-Isochrysis_galbana.AAC.4
MPPLPALSRPPPHAAEPTPSKAVCKIKIRLPKNSSFASAGAERGATQGHGSGRLALACAWGVGLALRRDCIVGACAGLTHQLTHGRMWRYPFACLARSSLSRCVRPPAEPGTV